MGIQIEVGQRGLTDPEMQKVIADAVPDQADKKRIGLLTYIKRNRKRWLREIKNNPVKWMRFKEKLKKLTAFGQTKKLDKDNQIR